MRALFAGYFEELRSLFDELGAAIDGLPPAALDWSPGPEMNSITVLVSHIAGSARYWANDVALDKGATTRVRADEFQTRNVTGEELRHRLAVALEEVRAALDALSDADLSGLRTAPTDGRQVSVGWALAHTLGHSATHVGQVQLTRQLWEQCPPAS
jgi:uncharacterized damage-inducible protein DinB